jgi:hypothetical protein
MNTILWACFSYQPKYGIPTQFLSAAAGLLKGQNSVRECHSNVQKSDQTERQIRRGVEAVV